MANTIDNTSYLMGMDVELGDAGRSVKDRRSMVNPGPGEGLAIPGMSGMGMGQSMNLSMSMSMGDLGNMGGIEGFDPLSLGSSMLAGIPVGFSTGSGVGGGFDPASEFLSLFTPGESITTANTVQGSSNPHAPPQYPTQSQSQLQLAPAQLNDQPNGPGPPNGQIPGGTGTGPSPDGESELENRIHVSTQFYPGAPIFGSLAAKEKYQVLLMKYQQWHDQQEQQRLRQNQKQQHGHAYTPYPTRPAYTGPSSSNMAAGGNTLAPSTIGTTGTSGAKPQSQATVPDPVLAATYESYVANPPASDVLLVSSDSVFFYAHANVLRRDTDNGFGGLLGGNGTGGVSAGESANSPSPEMCFGPGSTSGSSVSGRTPPLIMAGSGSSGSESSSGSANPVGDARGNSGSMTARRAALANPSGNPSRPPSSFPSMGSRSGSLSGSFSGNGSQTNSPLNLGMGIGSRSGSNPYPPPHHPHSNPHSQFQLQSAPPGFDRATSTTLSNASGFSGRSPASAPPPTPQIADSPHQHGLSMLPGQSDLDVTFSHQQQTVHSQPRPPGVTPLQVPHQNQNLNRFPEPSQPTTGITSRTAAQLTDASNSPNANAHPDPSNAPQNQSAAADQDLSTILLVLPESSQVLNILLHSLYALDCSHYSPSFETLVESVDVAGKYGYKSVLKGWLEPPPPDAMVATGISTSPRDRSQSMDSDTSPILPSAGLSGFPPITPAPPLGCGPGPIRSAKRKSTGGMVPHSPIVHSHGHSHLHPHQPSISAPSVPQPPSAVPTLYTLILSYAPSRPLDVYIFAASRSLESIAIASSSYLLAHPLHSLTDQQCSEMGAIYLKRLFFLHLGRVDALKRLLLPPPLSHDPTPLCSAADQKKLTRAWALATSYLLIDARPDTSVGVIESALLPLGDHLWCEVCRGELKERVEGLLKEWTAVKMTI